MGKNRIDSSTLYRKNEKGRYVSAGMDLQHNALDEGLWLVKHNKHSKSYSSVAYLLDKYRDYDLRIDDIATIQKYGSEIMNNVLRKFDDIPYSKSDIIESVLAEIISKIKLTEL